MPPLRIRSPFRICVGKQYGRLWLYKLQKYAMSQDPICILLDTHKTKVFIKIESARARKEKEGINEAVRDVMVKTTPINVL